MGQKNKEEHTYVREVIKDLIPHNYKLAIELASESASSKRLSTKPLDRHEFTLHKGDSDALCIQYDWECPHPHKICM